jgi:hypothetical protein
MIFAKMKWYTICFIFLGVVILVGGIFMISSSTIDDIIPSYKDKVVQSAGEELEKERQTNIEHTSSTDKTCNGNTCTLTLYSGIRNVYENNTWKKVENARSLKGSGINCLVNSDGENIVECVDWNMTSMTLRLSQKTVSISNKEVPIKIYSINNSCLDKKCNTMFTKSEERQTFSISSNDKEIILNSFKYGDVVHFGENSTIIQLKEANTENLKDAYVSEQSTNSNYGLVATGYIEGDTSAYVRRAYLSFNLSKLYQLGNITIINASFLFFVGDMSSNTNFSIHEIYSDWKNKTDNNILNETQITWNNQPCGLGYNGNYNNTNCNTTAESWVNVSELDAYNWVYNLSITNMIKRQYSLGSNVSSFMVRGEEVNTPSSTSASIYLKERADNYIPYINITYELPTDTSYPIFSTYWDNNGTQQTGGTGLFNVTLMNTNGTVILTYNNTNYTASNNSGDGTRFNVTLTGLTNGTYPYNWSSYGNGTSHNYNISNVRTYDVNATDTSYPIFSTYWDNNGTQQTGGTGLFNVTLMNTNGTVILTYNNTNYTASNNSGDGTRFNVTLTGLTNGTYPYNWSSYGNGTSHNYNISNVRTYDVNASILNLITNCSNLSVANTYYTLSNPIVNHQQTTSCINITAQNITLNCKGNIIFSLMNITGIFTDQKNTTIQDCNVTVGTSENINAIGISLRGANDSTVFNNTAGRYNFYGILINGTMNSSIKNNRAESNGSYALILYNSNYNNILNNVLWSNITNNFYMFSSSYNNVTNNSGNSRAGSNFYITTNSKKNNFTGNSGNTTTGSGFVITVNSADNIFYNNTMRTQSGNGFYSYLTRNNTFYYNNGTSVSSFGFYLLNTNNSVFINTISQSGTSNSIRILLSNNNTFINHKALATGTASTAINVSRSNNTYFIDCLNVTGNRRTVYVNDSKNVTMINCSYSTVGTNETVTALSTFVKMWYYRAYANDSSGNNVSASLNASNSTGSDGFLITTNSNGWTNITNIIDYWKVGTNVYYHSNYTITATNSSYNPTTSSHPFNSSLGNQLYDLFTFIIGGADSCTYTSGNWIVNIRDNCTISSDTDISPNILIINGSGGSFTCQAKIVYKQLFKLPSLINGGYQIIKKSGCSMRAKA